MFAPSLFYSTHWSSSTTPGHSGLGGNGSEGVFHIPQISKAEASPSDGLVLYTGHISHLFAPSLFYSTHWSSSTTPGQSGFGGNGSEGVLHIPQISKVEASPSDGLVLYTGHSVSVEAFLPLGKDAVVIFYSPS